MSFKQTSVMVEIDVARERFEQEVRNHKNKYIFQGTVFMILGILSAALPEATALSVELLIGGILLVSGILQFVLTVRSKMHWWSILSALLSIFTGILMLWKPLIGLLAVATLLAIFMTIEGFIELLLAFEYRRIRNWGWMFFSGLITLLLAVILWVGYPTIPVLYLGWVIAINFLLYGFSLMMLVWRVSA